MKTEPGTTWREWKRNWGAVLFFLAAIFFVLGRVGPRTPVEMSLETEVAATRLCRVCGQKFLSGDGQCPVCGARDSSRLPDAMQKRSQQTPLAPSIGFQQPMDVQELQKESGSAR